MKHLIRIGTIITLLASSSLVAASPSSIAHSSQASKHSALAAGHLIIAGAKTAATVVAIPLIILGEAGKVSTTAGTSLLKSAKAYTPLEITDTVITQDPSPAAAMQ